MFEWAANCIANQRTAQKLRAENAQLRLKVDQLENTVDMLSTYYEKLSKKYFAMLVEKPGRYPSDSKQLDSNKAWLAENDTKFADAKTAQKQAHGEH